MGIFCKTNINLFILILIFAAEIFGLIAQAEAAEFYFDIFPRDIGVGDEIEITSFIGTENERINAVEGAILFPSELMDLVDVFDGNSIVDIWLQKPVSDRKGKIIFSGIIPGGFAGTQEPFSLDKKAGKLFTMIFKARKSGDILLEFQDINALLNDGRGTPTETFITPLSFKIVKKEVILPRIAMTDNTPPEIFVPEIAKTPEIFNGKYFLAFNTQDKESGVDHFEVKEGNSLFMVAESPYLLRNQNLDEPITVKAVDKKGNERTIVLQPLKPRMWYKKYSFILIIGLILFLMIAVKKLIQINDKN